MAEAILWGGLLVAAAIAYAGLCIASAVRGIDITIRLTTNKKEEKA